MIERCLGFIGTLGAVVCSLLFLWWCLSDEPPKEQKVRELHKEIMDNAERLTEDRDGTEHEL